MLLLNPGQVTFDGEEWNGVSAVTIDREPGAQIIEWGDDGPHVVFADVPEQRVTVRIVRALETDDPDGPLPGDEAELVLHTSPRGTDAGRRRITVRVVVLGVEHELSRRRGVERTVTMVAVSPDGDVDPVTIEDAIERTVPRIWG